MRKSYSFVKERTVKLIAAAAAAVTAAPPPPPSSTLTESHYVDQAGLILKSLAVSNPETNGNATVACFPIVFYDSIRIC